MNELRVPIVRRPPALVSRNTLRHIGRWVALLAVCLAGLGPAPAGAQRTGDYLLGPQDVLTIAVLNQPALGGKYAVESDGSFSFPLIGRVKVSGLTTVGLELELRRRLADGFFNNPEITIAVEQYRSQRVYVMGEVRNPGAYSLAGNMTVFEALASAGSATSQSADEVVIVHGKHVRAGDVPAMDGDDVIRIRFEDLDGAASRVRDIDLRDGDVIYVPRAGLVYVFGEVKNPGSYPIRSGTTVLQALSLAGGVLSTGATTRIRVVKGAAREAAKEIVKEVKVKLNDVVEPGDTIVVPERFF